MSNNLPDGSRKALYSDDILIGPYNITSPFSDEKLVQQGPQNQLVWVKK